MNAAAKLLDGKEATGGAARILIVEDERIVARSLRKQLTTLGYEVVANVPSGEEAIRQTGEIRPDLVLMDINLEGPMDGVEAAATIRKQFRLPVVYLTAYSNKEILDRAKVTEPFGYILKPYEDRELHVVIETALYKHRMEQRQQEREQRFVATLKSIGDAVVATDDEGRITYLNPVAESLTGWVSQDALGQPLQEVVRLVHEDSRQPVESFVGQAMQDGTPSTCILLIARDHSEKTIENCVALITDEQGVVVGIVVVFRDVTWRKEVEAQYRQAKQMEGIGRLAGGVAHALNNLMTVALGHSEIMLDGMKPGDPFFESAQEIKRSATRTATLTQKLLAFGRNQILTLRPVDLNAVVGGLAPAARHMQSGVRLDLSLEPGLGLTRADPDQLEEAILTLVRNACEAMPQGGRVTIHTTNVELGTDYTHDHPEVRPGSYILVAVSDTGVGMNREAINHLFEPFYTKEAGLGAGLGLAAVYGFVKQCGGDIEVRSQPEKGTTFRLYLPREGAGSVGTNRLQVSSVVPDGPRKPHERVERRAFLRPTKERSLSSTHKGGAMTQDHGSEEFSQDMGKRFDLLATDVKEYALFLVEPGGKVLCWNPGAERLFGYRSDEIIGQHFSRFFSPEDIRNGQPEHELNTAADVGRSDSIRWQVRKDGTRFWCQSIVTPLLDEKKQARSYARVMHDLTEGEAAQAQTRRADGLAEANRDKEEFMALLSHELRSPLSPILNALNIMRQMRTTDPLIEQAGNIIDRQVGAMVKLVDDLLDISRITKGKLRLTKEDVELRVVVNHAAETARPLIDARKHEFSVVLPTQPIWVQADPARLEQCVVNLLNNAAKYTDVGGLIRVTVEREGSEAVIRVKDNGVGIDPEKLSQIFELFTQVDGSLGRSYGGLGIGLALVRSLMEIHDGRVTAASAGPGKGCEFTLKLPLLEGTPPQETKTVVVPGQPPGRSLRVLVVEDNADAADSLSLLLRLYGYEVQVARSGPTALEMASTTRPDVVLLDIGLPGMDGYQVAKCLREKPEFKDMILCALTGYTPSEADRQRQQETGFDHYYVKPVDLAKLLELFQTVGLPAT